MESLLSRMRLQRLSRPVLALLLLVEVIACTIQLTTEVTYSFDWDAYMEEVSGVFLGGVTDYSQLKGDTGPLVYPAGFVWLYTALYWLTGWDHTVMTTEIVPKNITGYENRTLRPEARIHEIQAMFVVLYAVTLLLIIDIYRRSRLVPQWAFLLLCISRRVRAIFFLGFFNDCFSTCFVYLAVWLFMRDRWLWGCIWFSAAVSIKMNVLLFAPALLVLLLQRFGVRGAMRHVAVCALVQVVVAAPFLVTHPVAYLAGAFDLGRQFFIEWSVNFHWLPEPMFTSKWPGRVLLGLTVLANGAFAARKWQASGDSASRILQPGHVALVLFTGNMIGIAFARSMHYQFLVWYFHTLPLLLAASGAHELVSCALMIVLEVAWNEHPPAGWSSLVVLLCHLAIVWLLWRRTAGKQGHKRGMGWVGLGGASREVAP